jgi:multimeric flavodoxin WrbA
MRYSLLTLGSPVAEDYNIHLCKRCFMATPKETAKHLIDDMPDEATWDEIMYELYVKQKIEEGLQASEEGRTIPQEEAKERLLGNAD